MSAGNFSTKRQIPMNEKEKALIYSALIYYAELSEEGISEDYRAKLEGYLLDTILTKLEELVGDEDPEEFLRSYRKT
jgi:hypothetical protein